MGSSNGAAVMSIDKRTGARGVRYEVRFRGPDGKERSRTFRTKAEAIAYEADQRSTLNRGAWVDPRSSARTLKEVAAEWLASNPAKRGSSRARDRGTLERHVLPHLGAHPIGRVTPADVQGLVNAWAEVRKPSTVARDYRIVAAVFRYALNRDLIGRTPCRAIKLPKGQPKPVHVITAAELAPLAAAMGDYAPMPYLGAVLGLRWGEVAALRVRSLDLLGGSLAVTEGLSRDENGQPMVDAPKSDAGRRTLAIPVELGEMLAAHLAARGLTAADADALLFPSPTGDLLRYSNWLRRVWYPACAAAGLGTLRKVDGRSSELYEGLGFHDLRRASATGLVSGGIDIKTAQTRLGHSSSRLTLDLYAQAEEALDRAAADVLGARFFSRVESTRGKNAG